MSNRQVWLIMPTLSTIFSSPCIFCVPEPYVLVLLSNETFDCGIHIKVDYYNQLSVFLVNFLMLRVFLKKKSEIFANNRSACQFFTKMRKKSKQCFKIVYRKEKNHVLLNLNKVRVLFSLPSYPVIVV